MALALVWEKYFQNLFATSGLGRSPYPRSLLQLKVVNTLENLVLSQMS